MKLSCVALLQLTAHIGYPYRPERFKTKPPYDRFTYGVGFPHKLCLSSGYPNQNRSGVFQH